MKRLCKWLAVKCARQAGLDFVLLPRIPTEVLQSAREFCAQVSAQPTSGEHKRGQVMRALINVHPGIPERVLAAAIEVAICSVA